MENEIGMMEGEPCNRETPIERHCAGVMQDKPVEGCTCFINPPCSACMRNWSYCPLCGAEAIDDE